MHCFDAFEERFLVSFLLEKFIHLNHFSQYVSFLASENLKKQ